VRIRFPLCTLVFLAAAPNPVFAEDKVLVELDGRGAIGAGIAGSTKIETPQKSVAIELGIGLRIGLERAPPDKWVLALLPEVSYAALSSLDHKGLFHSGVFGLGLGKTDGSFLVGVIPAFVYSQLALNGEAHQTGYGGRVLFTAEILHWVGIQASYQATAFERGWIHDVRATLSLNFIGIFAAVLLTRGSF
jgi:hypothetical protein